MCQNPNPGRKSRKWPRPETAVYGIHAILHWRTIGFCNLNTHEGEEVAFSWLRSREALSWREFLLIIEANKIGDKVHCTASKVHETWLNYSFDFYYYAKPGSHWQCKHKQEDFKNKRDRIFFWIYFSSNPRKKWITRAFYQHPRLLPAPAPFTRDLRQIVYPMLLPSKGPRSRLMFQVT